MLTEACRQKNLADGQRQNPKHQKVRWSGISEHRPTFYRYDISAHGASCDVSTLIADRTESRATCVLCR